ncbi:alpha-1,3-mannosyl-glycoprotein 2-beta-N-acetylglucosaminyltransferase-like isoform X1 [Zingiber officinale]|uniref:alpha-1,3-mannosyl-glycoprotein 2-beta-N-acetylglucosaminyltransferase-like isoform X1 n=1 Tax=Zingiber officinale TaxID=94328 RepID=UPI001C4CB81D|nr:alpha-1,3-mannosyl-glycoprotein 2-beta-N-acetylglucosaminyltransferase-like isoform X1 [Zingiber officinale]
MARHFCDIRILLVIAIVAFIYIQVRLFTAQSEYAERLAAVVESENRCTSQMRLLIDQISTQQGKIVALEEANKYKDEESAQLKTLLQDLKKKSLQNLIGKNEEPVAAVVIMACNRPDYLERTVKSVLKYQRSVSSKFPLFISQDGTNPDVKTKAMSYNEIIYLQHVDLKPVATERPGEITAYYKIARHYKWALDELFVSHKFNRVIILEDDMEIAPDFFDYFEATATLLDKDKTIMAVSSWNDNGQKQFVHDPRALYRSDFFPGLGWMLTKSTWDELSPKWPKAYWDDWVRLKEVHKDRQFIRPEICRTYNFGEHGSSMGQFFRQYLEPIKLNDVQVDWKSANLSFLMEDKFLSHFAKMVSDATPIWEPEAILKAHTFNSDVKIQYRDQAHFEQIARKFGIFDEWKDGIPRTAYKGVVVFRHRSERRVFLVAPDSLSLLGIE